MRKHKRDSRSRSRSKSGSKNANNYRDRDRSRQSQKQKRKTHHHHHHSKNSRKRQYSSSEHSQSSNSDRSNQHSNDSSKQKGRGGVEHNQHEQPRYKVEETKTLKIQRCNNKEAAERALTDASITAGTSVPDQIEVKDDSVFAKYPSIQVSTKIKQLLKQVIIVNGEEHRINFYPYKRIDLNMAYDWYCQNCQYKNFARRNKCYRCDYEKTSTCKLNYNTATPAPKGVSKQENINNCSLMIRGPIMTQTQQEVILQIFQAICSVKDIRMIRNKMTGQLKDFAFVEFFTPEDASLALKQANSPDFRVRGEKVSVMYSRNKSDDDYIKPLPYEKKERRKDFGKKQKKPDQPVESYYNKQRQLQIQQEKQRPIITIQQLKQKREQQLRKKAANARQLTQQQSKRRQAEIMAKQWQKQAKMQNTILYICVPCRRKFKGEPEMKLHQQNSKLHKFNKSKFQLSL